jgi:uncharacterized membrane protein YkoI
LADSTRPIRDGEIAADVVRKFPHPRTGTPRPFHRAKPRVYYGMKVTLVLITAGITLIAAPTVVRSQYDVPATSAAPRLTLDQLPAPVQDTVRKQAGGKEIAKIERETWNGQPGYRVQFKESGRNSDVYVADDGSLLRPEEKPPGAKTLFMGTKFEDTPAAVQETLRREVGAGEITKIDREGRKGQRFYKVRVKDPHGALYELQIGEDGKVVHDTRPAAKPQTR